MPLVPADVLHAWRSTAGNRVILLDSNNIMQLEGAPVAHKQHFLSGMESSELRVPPPLQSSLSAIAGSAATSLVLMSAQNIATVDGSLLTRMASVKLSSSFSVGATDGGALPPAAVWSAAGGGAGGGPPLPAASVSPPKPAPSTSTPVSPPGPTAPSQPHTPVAGPSSTSTAVSPVMSAQMAGGEATMRALPRPALQPGAVPDHWPMLKRQVLGLLREYSARIPGTRIIESDAVLALDHHAADPEWASIQIAFLAEEVAELVATFPDVRVVRGAQQLEVMLAGASIRHALATLAPMLKAADFVLAIAGADENDNELLEPLAQLLDDRAGTARTGVFTVTVGRHPSPAQFYVNDARDVHELLHALGRTPTNRMPSVDSPARAFVSP